MQQIVALDADFMSFDQVHNLTLASSSVPEGVWWR